MISLGVYAQEDNADFQSKKLQRSSSDYFPKAGDFGIGLDATPFLDYFGNAFNGTEDNTLDLGDNTLYFRYFLTDNSALRVALQVYSYKNVENDYVRDDAAFMDDPLSRKEVQDRSSYSENDYSVRLGYQVFKGQNRLRGFLGADVAFGYGSGFEKYEYGNQMTQLNPNPTTSFSSSTPGKRILEEKYDSQVTLGIGAFTGAEYYFMPNISVGVELGLIYGHRVGRQEYEKFETMVNTQYVVEEVALYPGDRDRLLMSTSPSSLLDTSSAYGKLYFMIHF